jgi:hypothetical protein
MPVQYVQGEITHAWTCQTCHDDFLLDDEVTNHVKTTGHRLFEYTWESF